MRFDIGMRVRYEDGAGFSIKRLIGATGTVVSTSDDLTTVHFDKNVHGWGEDFRYWTCLNSHLVCLSSPSSCGLEEFI